VVIKGRPTAAKIERRWIDASLALAALDEQTRTRMGHDLLDIWAATGKTVFFITHSLSEAIYLSDAVLVMSPRPGRIIDTIAIDFPRPRELDIIGSAAFGAIRNRIWHLISEAR